MMAWEAKEKGYDCNDCYLSMQNCHDMSICCEDETGLCDCFEEMKGEEDVCGVQSDPEEADRVSEAEGV